MADNDEAKLAGIDRKISNIQRIRDRFNEKISQLNQKKETMVSVIAQKAQLGKPNGG